MVRRLNFPVRDCVKELMESLSTDWDEETEREWASRLDAVSAQREDVMPDGDDTKKALATGVGAEGMLMLFGGGLIAMGRLGEAMNTVCADCESFVPSDDAWVSRLPGMEDLAPPCCLVTRKAASEGGPLWPGCRGFKHKEGTPGPGKRYQEATKAELKKARQRSKEVV